MTNTECGPLSHVSDLDAEHETDTAGSSLDWLQQKSRSKVSQIV